NNTKTNPSDPNNQQYKKNSKKRRVPNRNERQVGRGQQPKQRAIAKRLHVVQASDRRRDGHETAQGEAIHGAEIRSVILEADRDAGRRIASRTQRWGDRPVCATVSKRRPVTEQVVNPNSNRSLELSPERAGAGDQFFALRRAAGWLQQLHRLGSQDAG